MKLSFLEARTPDEITQAFASFAAQKLKAVLVNTDPYYLGRRDHLAELAARHSLPAIYSLREHVTSGGLISYGANLTRPTGCWETSLDGFCGAASRPRRQSNNRPSKS
jgi:putative ABC transport system substrate-binding protein